MKCKSCGKNVEAERNWVEFTCPACGEDKIIRCEHCKKVVISYKCSKCGFAGP
jgi:predicted RNA-binding Zn-ribbon protein involved in translation (DUF1610 family)